MYISFWEEITLAMRLTRPQTNRCTAVYFLMHELIYYQGKTFQNKNIFAKDQNQNGTSSVQVDNQFMIYTTCMSIQATSHTVNLYCSYHTKLEVFYHLQVLFYSPGYFSSMTDKKRKSFHALYTCHRIQSEIHACVCSSVCHSVCMCVCMCACMHACVCVFVCVCMCWGWGGGRGRCYKCRIFCWVTRVSPGVGMTGTKNSGSSLKASRIKWFSLKTESDKQQNTVSAKSGLSASFWVVFPWGNCLTKDVGSPGLGLCRRRFTYRPYRRPFSRWRQPTSRRLQRSTEGDWVRGASACGADSSNIHEADRKRGWKTDLKHHHQQRRQ